MENSFIFDFNKSKSRDQLYSDNKLFGDSGIRPDDVQSISNIRPFIKAVASNQHHQVSIGKAESIILIGLDSIKYDFAKANLTPQKILPLTSTFPSTSVCAWTCALTGQIAEKSRMVSPIFYAHEIDGMYITLNDRYEQHGEWKSDNQGAQKFPIKSLDNFFTDLNLFGFETICINGAYAYTISRWSQALLKDANRVEKSRSDWNLIIFSPEKIVESIIEDVTHALESRDTNRHVFIWSLIDMDSYIHVFGYSKDLKEALKRLDDFFHSLASKGHLVVSFADHGQVPQKISTLSTEWNKILSDKYCRCLPAGAGRTRWCYPKAGMENFVLEQTKEILGHNAAVVHRDELDSLSILPIGENLKIQVGEVIAMALTDDFPLALYGDNFIYEHGSITKDEMCVPLMVWTPSYYQD